uniref:Amino acid transporter transmembrane domain-containing protein n=1 Tax=Chromera velia CCMP2878 TaxID=1169474 RepID=A0A0G4FZZ6_9ALVE|eukprot:Cvel_3951.t1-p1 / transcript=Cvel_3951.t1 / gene=Cvel_3951 / organism=Chromera_velia_CCMP2878 / gene_product=Lysine histidine transporter-like 1, putative / transcript_product=Lysine histidine transporter-like 1, putative / location=Cvel_scaffold168:2449-5619(-) / protein_length=883 / sequence_SO=supercontig / SO=protein_coding / is_pseudo=false
MGSNPAASFVALKEAKTGQRASVADATVSILCGILGAGIVGLPNAMARIGWSGVAILILMAGLSTLNGCLLSACAEKCKELEEREIENMLRDRERDREAGVEGEQEGNPEDMRTVRLTYGDVGARCLGSVGRCLVVISQSGTSIGTCILFLVLLGASGKNLFPHWTLSKQAWSGLCAGLLVPFLALRTLTELHVLAFCGMASSLIVAAVLFLQTVVGPGEMTFQEGEPEFDPKSSFVPFMLGLGALCFAFSGHVIFLDVRHCMKKPNDFRWAAISAYSVSFVVYFLLCVTMYATFGSDLLSPGADDALSLLPPESFSSKLAICLIALHVFAAFLIFMNPVFLYLESALKIEAFEAPTTSGFRTIPPVHLQQSGGAGGGAAVAAPPLFERRHRLSPVPSKAVALTSLDVPPLPVGGEGAVGGVVKHSQSHGMIAYGDREGGGEAGRQLLPSQHAVRLLQSSHSSNSFLSGTLAGTSQCARVAGISQWTPQGSAVEHPRPGLAPRGNNGGGGQYSPIFSGSPSHGLPFSFSVSPRLTHQHGDSAAGPVHPLRSAHEPHEPCPASASPGLGRQSESEPVLGAPVKGASGELEGILSGGGGDPRWHLTVTDKGEILAEERETGREVGKVEEHQEGREAETEQQGVRSGSRGEREFLCETLEDSFDPPDSPSSSGSPSASLERRGDLWGVRRFHEEQGQEEKRQLEEASDSTHRFPFGHSYDEREPGERQGGRPNDDSTEEVRGGGRGVRDRVAEWFSSWTRGARSVVNRENEGGGFVELPRKSWRHSWWALVGIRSIFVAVMVLVAIFVPFLGEIQAVVGSSFITAQSFIFPPLFASLLLDDGELVGGRWGRLGLRTISIVSCLFACLSTVCALFAIGLKLSEGRTG